MNSYKYVRPSVRLRSAHVHSCLIDSSQFSTRAKWIRLDAFYDHIVYTTSLQYLKFPNKNHWAIIYWHISKRCKWFELDGPIFSTPYYINFLRESMSWYGEIVPFLIFRNDNWAIIVVWYKAQLYQIWIVYVYLWHLSLYKEINCTWSGLYLCIFFGTHSVQGYSRKVSLNWNFPEFMTTILM